MSFCIHFFKFQFLLILVAALAGVYYPQILQSAKDFIFEFLGWRSQSTQDSAPDKYLGEGGSEHVQLFTKSELAKYNGENGAPLYLSLLGSVYDVTKGRKHYGKGCTYNSFVGRDASVSFITGEFDSLNDKTADDVNALKPSDLLSLLKWKEFYDKEYTLKGWLIGRFYDANSFKTKYHHQFDALVHQAKTSKATADKLQEVYPDCNIEWSPETGTKVWCTKTSGGKERNWSGYPRKLFELGRNSYRCACVPSDNPIETSLMVQLYDNCDQLSHTCYYNVD